MGEAIASTTYTFPAVKWGKLSLSSIYIFSVSLKYFAIKSF